LKLAHGIFGVFKIAPVYGILTAEGGLVNLRVWRCGRDATEIDRLHTESIGRAKHGTHVIETPHIVEDDNEGQLLGLLELLQGQPVHFDGLEFTHDNRT
jgi:hypothetical protein